MDTHAATVPDPRAESLTAEPPGTWTDVLAHLEEAAGTAWLTTTRRDAEPHTRPVLAVWVDGRPCFASGEETAKSRRLVRDTRVSLALDTGRLHVVVEGTAAPVLDAEPLERVALAYADRYGWAPTPGDGFLTGPQGAPTAGPPPYRAYAVTPAKVYAFPAADDVGHGATRWTFPG
ncbi:pyridoxamine 5'-phosphate oxidase [Nocardiopsis sp. Huas11]|uniref:pyridoxamine 5'-phosphate oxidase family protein n=1 Tax=Nocardiopsis sp. Huas11 TaxID=2183912 RepID=UPI000EAED40E|nr:pyridoxamine 5'-phosphate oxidase family protein [Nocardiopsis sp. Huas11]RKS09113.1 pyridoxamine 5'-phosphate oxidase [Nocardiopsis sp. Huas11]